jgi:hypothetical protein
MNIIRILIIILLPVIVIAQQGFDVTGRVSLRVTNNDYDETSKIKPDSIADSEYGKTTIIPGLRQSLNIALFARTAKVDMTLLGDIRNDKWNELDIQDMGTINRLSLSARFGTNEIILGDFYESGSELFVQCREVRGAKVHLKFNGLWNKNSFLETKTTGGIVQKAFSSGSRLNDLYKQYETSGQYRRYFASGILRIGEINLYKLAVNYLYAKDDDKSIDESINEPLINHNAGVNGSLYLLDKKIFLFGEGYTSRKDTISASSIDDHAYKAGFDLSLKRFELTAFYQRIGYDYYSAGYPFLNTDRQGVKVDGAIRLPEAFIFTLEAEQYNDNLNDTNTLPTTYTKLGKLGVTTNFKNLPELTIQYGLRYDDSNTLFVDSIKMKTEKVSGSWEGRISYNFKVNRLSLSAMYIDFNDKSLLAAGTPLGTEQFIANFNFYTRPSPNFFISCGSVYSRLLMSNDQENKNLYVYESSRWDIIPQKLKLESNICYINNDASNGEGYQDMLSDYYQISGEISLEYFFTSNLSFKTIAGTDKRNMSYSIEQALQVMTDPDYGPMFFNGYETYQGMIYGAEINWIF